MMGEKVGLQGCRTKHDMGINSINISFGHEESKLVLYPSEQTMIPLVAVGLDIMHAVKETDT